MCIRDSLCATEAARADQAAAHSTSHFARALAPCGAVDRLRCAIGAIFIKDVRDDAHSPPIGRLISRGRIAGEMGRSQLAINRPAWCDPGILLGGYRNVAVDVEPFAACAVSPAARATAGKERHASSAEAAALDERSSGRAPRSLREELHHAADRIRTIQVAAAAALHLHA